MLTMEVEMTAAIGDASRKAAGTGDLTRTEKVKFAAGFTILALVGLLALSAVVVGCWG